MIISKQDYDTLMQLIKSQNETIAKQNRMLMQIKEEVKHATKLIGFYEACITKGVKIDFPNSTVKGGNADNTGEIDFSDF